MTRLAPFIFISFLLHGFILISNPPWPSRRPVGHSAQSDNRIYVEIVAEQDATARAQSPSSLDSQRAQEAEPSPESKEKIPKPEPEPEEADERPRSQSSPNLLAMKSPDPDAGLMISQDQLNEIVEEHNGEERLEETDPEEALKRPETQEPEDIREEAPESPVSVASLPQRASLETRKRAASGHDLADYKARIISAITKASYFPRSAARSGRHGEAIVRFTVMKDGSLAKLELLKKTEFKSLNNAAMEIVKKASENFPEAPHTYTGPSLTYAVPIKFRKRAKNKH